MEEDDDAGRDEARDRPRYIRSLERCINKSAGECKMLLWYLQLKHEYHANVFTYLYYNNNCSDTLAIHHIFIGHLGVVLQV